MRGVRSVNEPTARSQCSLPALDRIMTLCRCGGHGRWPRKELGRHSPRNAGHPHAACMPRAASSQRQARGRGGAPRVGLVGQLDGHDGGVLVVDHAVDRVLAQQDELDVVLEGLCRAGGGRQGRHASTPMIRPCRAGARASADSRARERLPPSYRAHVRRVLMQTPLPCPPGTVRVQRSSNPGHVPKRKACAPWGARAHRDDLGVGVEQLQRLAGAQHLRARHGVNAGCRASKRLALGPSLCRPLCSGSPASWQSSARGVAWVALGAFSQARSITLRSGQAPNMR